MTTTIHKVLITRQSLSTIFNYLRNNRRKYRGALRYRTLSFRRRHRYHRVVVCSSQPQMILIYSCHAVISADAFTHGFIGRRYRVRSPPAPTETLPSFNDLTSAGHDFPLVTSQTPQPEAASIDNHSIHQLGEPGTKPLHNRRHPAYY